MKKCELFEKSDQEAWIFILVVSSTGEGEPPDNAKRFNRDVRKKVDLIKKDAWLSNSLSEMKFYLLGLGSSEYAKYQGYPIMVNS